mgnify:CR=1 FL=1
MPIIILTSYYLFILIPIIGFGYFFSRILYLNISRKDVMMFGLLGVIALTFISYLTNIFFAHDFTHNIFIYLVGLFFFIYALTKNKIDKTSFIKILFIAFILLILSLLSKTHDDFGWYHLPYTLNISQNKFQFGLGAFNHGFRTPSSLFYLNSLFYFPIIKFYSFNFAQLYIFLFGLIYFYKTTFNKFNSNALTFFYSLLAFIFVIVVFYRLGEHGTDRSGQLIIFIVIIFVLEIIKDKSLDFNKINLLIIFLTYIITTKTYFIIFAILFLPILFKFNNDFRLYKKIIFSRVVLFSLIFLLMHFSIQLANTGCLFYPMNFTCIPNLSWSINEEEIIWMAQHYELWAKSGVNPNFRIENESEYIENFNWVSRWFSEYFFTKVSDTILGIITILLICYFSFKNKSKKYILNYKKEINILLLCIFITLAIWFTKFPQLRYGGYVIAANIFFLPFCIYIFNFKLNKKIFRRAKVLVAISIIVFSSRNINRLIHEIEFYNYKPLKNTYFRIEKPKYEEKMLNDSVILNKTDSACWSIPQPCARSATIQAKKIKNYIIYWRE